MATTETPPVVTEDEKVERWRETSFRRQGYTNDQITLLLFFGVDHHESDELLRQGCPHDIVIDILRG